MRRLVLLLCISLSGCKSAAPPALVRERVQEAWERFRIHPADAERWLVREIRAEPTVRKHLDAFLPVLRRLVDLEAWPNAWHLHRALWNAGLRNSEMERLETELYYRTRRGKLLGVYSPAARIPHHPAVRDGVMYHVAAAGVADTSKLRAYGLRAAAPAWPEPVDLVAPIFSGVMLVGDRVVVVTAGGTVHCRAAGDGREVWKARLGVRLRRPARLAAGDSFLLVAAGNELYGLRLSDGRREWKTRIPEGILKFLVVHAGSAWVGVDRRTASEVRRFDLKAGKADPWVFEGAAPLAPGLATWDGGIALASSKLLVGLGGRDMKPLWRTALPDTVGLPPVTAGTVAVVAFSKEGLAAYDLPTGDQRWSARFSVRAPMAAARGGLYLLDSEGRIRALSIADGSERFESECGRPGPWGIMLDSGLVWVPTQVPGTGAAEVWFFDSGDRKVGGWNQRGGNPGRTGRGTE